MKVVLVSSDRIVVYSVNEKVLSEAIQTGNIGLIRKHGKYLYDIDHLFHDES